jgi:hypothetical protein
LVNPATWALPAIALPATGANLFIGTTFDSLYDGQMGLDMVLLGSRNQAWIEGLGKAGISYNNASQNSFVDSVSTHQIVRSTHAAADQPSVNNLFSNLFSNEIESGIANGETVFLYGVNLGLQAAW